jgi:thiamine kinase-like enzyme
MISEKKIAKIFDKFGKSVLSSSFLGKGEASTVLKIITNKGKFALKTALFPKRKDKVLNEAKFRKYFIDHGLSCVPAPLYADSEIFPNGAVIYEFVEGIEPDFRKVRNINQMAQILSQIHQIEYEIVEDGFSQIMKLFKFLEKITRKISTEYHQFMNDSIQSAFSTALSEYKALLDDNKALFSIGINAQLHGDLSNNCLMDQNDKIWLIDWENSEYGDVMEELCWFLSCNEISKENQVKFFQEYQNKFPETKQIRFDKISKFYDMSTPVFNICWGIDQMATQLDQNLEPPDRKLKDLAISASNWVPFYSEYACSLIMKGIQKLKRSLLG